MKDLNKKAYEIGGFANFHLNALTGSTITFTTTEDITDQHSEKVGLFWRLGCPSATLVYENDKDFYNTVKFAIKNNVDIVLCSQYIRYSKYDKEEKQMLLDVIQEAKDNNVFIAIAAGNDRENIDGKPYVNSLDGLVTIGAVDVNLRPASFTNKGESVEYVDVGILYDEEEDWLIKGTSFAQPLFQAKIGLLIDWFKTNNVLYDYSLIYKIVNENLIETKAGKGLFVLPKLEELEVYKMSEPKQIRDLEELTPEARYCAKKCLEEWEKAGIKALIYETYRTQERQDYLYKQGRVEPYKNNAKVTWTTNSKHTSRNAFDACPLDSKGNCDWNNTKSFAKMGEVAEKIGITWGGRWDNPDMPHFQYDGSPLEPEEDVSSWAKASWEKAKNKKAKDGITSINDGVGAKNNVTEEQVMVYFDRLGLLD